MGTNLLLGMGLIRSRYILDHGSTQVPSQVPTHVPPSSSVQVPVHIPLQLPMHSPSGEMMSQAPSQLPSQMPSHGPNPVWGDDRVFEFELFLGPGGAAHNGGPVKVEPYGFNAPSNIDPWAWNSSAPNGAISSNLWVGGTEPAHGSWGQ